MENEAVKPGLSNEGGVGMKVREDFRRTVCLLQQRSLWHCLLLLGKFRFWISSRRESELRHTSVIILSVSWQMLEHSSNYLKRVLSTLIFHLLPHRFIWRTCACVRTHKHTHTKWTNRNTTHTRGLLNELRGSDDIPLDHTVQQDNIFPTQYDQVLWFCLVGQVAQSV
jgi:hypothetical protein